MLINMRNAMLSGGRPTAKDFVQDGLVAMWDGIENAGPGESDLNATKWINIVEPSEYALSLGLGSWTGKARRHTSPGTSSNPWCAAYYDGSVPNDVHVEFCCDITGIQGTNNGGCLVYRNRVGGNATDDAVVPILEGVLRSSPPTTVWRGATNRTQVTLPVDFYKGFHTWSFGLRSFTIDAMQYAVSGNYVRAWSDSKLEFFGRGAARTYHTYGDIYCVRLYSRALPAEEISRNYAIDKERFNLPDA